MQLEVDEDWYWLRAIFGALDDPVLNMWSQIVIPSIVGLASVLVATASVVAASKASGIARRSEAARAQSEIDRVQQDARRREAEAVDAYKLRLESALVHLFQAVGDHLRPLAEWMEQADQVEQLGLTDGYGELLYPPDPPLHELNASCDVIRLVARGSDIPVVDALGHAMVVADRTSGPRRRILLGAFVNVLREWWGAKTTDDDAIRYFREIEAKYKAG